MAGKLGLLARDVGLQVGERLHEHVVGDHVNGAPRRGVETHQPRLALLDPQKLGDLQAARFTRAFDLTPTPGQAIAAV
jgi:hypothetical protein